MGGCMSPFDQAKQWCMEHGEHFYDELDLHLACGWVYSGEDAFVMATLEDSNELTGLSLNKTLDTDVWYVYLYAGDLKRVLSLMPFDKKYIAFRRNNGRIKLYEAEKLLRRI